MREQSLDREFVRRERAMRLAIESFGDSPATLGVNYRTDDLIGRAEKFLTFLTGSDTVVVGDDD